MANTMKEIELWLMFLPINPVRAACEPISGHLSNNLVRRGLAVLELLGKHYGAAELY